MIDAAKRASLERWREVLLSEFRLELECGSHIVVPPGTEVVYFCLYDSGPDTPSPVRVEGVFYLPDGETTINVIGSHGRSKRRRTSEDYARKTVLVKHNAKFPVPSR